MDSRPLLKAAKKMGVYLDSKTFDDLLNNNDRLGIAILRHYNSDCLDFVRSPFETTFDELKNIVEYELIPDEESNIYAIKITRNESKETWYFRYKIFDIKEIAQKIVYKRGNISDIELNRVITVFIQAVFNRSAITAGKSERANIYVTNDKILLKNRLWFESHFPGYQLNIMSVEEASAFLDLFFKRNGKYYADSRYQLNRGGWYWFSMRLKIPHYNVGDAMIGALAYRLYYALMALDEMGIQYYLGVNNDTMDNTLYHFNYMISLITGIFDNLALKTNTFLGINFTDLRKVSLSNRSGREFLKEIRDKNKSIRTHINSNVNFIKLIYSFRELVVHREGLSTTSFNCAYGGDGEKWAANFIKISEETKEDIKHFGDVDIENDPFSKWGVYQSHSEFYLNPYHFSMQAITMIVEFVDRYLELLGYSSFIETRNQIDDNFTRTLKYFEKYHLGF